MIIGIRNNYSVGVADSNVVRMFELSRFVSHSTKLCDKRSVALENLDSVIFFVTNINESQCICADSPWIVELSICGSLTSKCSEEVTTGVKYLYPVIVAVSDDVLTDPVDCYSC